MMAKTIRKILMGLLMTGFFAANASAEGCTDKLFSVTMNSETTIGDAVDNLAETCGLTVIVKDAGAQHRLNKKLYYMKLKNASLKSFLDTLLTDNDLSYSLRGNKLVISYFITKTYKLHYIAGYRQGENKTVVNLSSSTDDSDSKSDNGSNIKITSKYKFDFWMKIKDEIKKILRTANDAGAHYTRVKDAWIGPDGQKWEYNPLDPIVNRQAGLITVTGTARQIARVDRYISALMKQAKAQVMIDVRIIDVRLNNNRSTGIDWNKIFDSSLSWGGHYNFSGIGHDNGAISFGLQGDLTGILKFLNSQGDVTVVSSPRVMTLNNQPAIIRAGQKINYVIYDTKITDSGAIDKTAKPKNIFVGILLSITPEIDERGMVTLKINPTISELVDKNEVISQTERTVAPDTFDKQISAVIKVKDGNHAILGGMITRTKGVKSDKVPLLGSIPLLGHAFKREEVTDVTDELVLIITPHIIRPHKNLTLKDLGYSKLR
ncbi:type II secretion system protein GspD [Nitratifractor sp.]|uniref:type II secretion system protein GspD n=1 Tax=Nitratifractor sp. TaxID=2268144 RepID=UPI0025DAE0AA|nr:secretin N-terminal domain-containing protein [Nitratifractor sp.]